MTTSTQPGGPSTMWERPQFYDAMVDWEARKRTEMAFYRRHLGDAKLRVLDVACGPGRHVLWLTEHGYIVEGCDHSAAMVAYAQQAALLAEREVEFFQADMTALPADRGPYDALLSVGNSIAALREREQLEAFARSAASMLNPGGRLILQTVNLARLAGKGPQYQPVRSGMVDGTETLFLKVMEYPVDGRGRVDIVTMRRGPGAWTTDVHHGSVSAWTRDDLDEALRDAGFTADAWFGAHDDTPFDVSTSRDILLVARRNA